MSDILGMTATEFVLFQENKRLKAMNEYLQMAAGPANIYAAHLEPQEMKVRAFTRQLNIAVQTYVKDDGYGYHVIANAYSGLHTAYYVDRLALAKLNDWSIADVMKRQLEQVTMGLVAALTKEKGLPTLAQNLDHSQVQS